MKRIRLLAVLCLLSLLLSLSAFGTAGSSGELHHEGTRIRVFQTTDIHGYLVDTSSGEESTYQYRLAYIAAQVNQARADSSYADVLLLDSGDVYQGAPVSNLLNGAALRAALDAMDYDAVGLGNHDFDWGVTGYGADEDATIPAYELGEFSGDPDIPVLATGLLDAETGERVDFTRDYVLVEKAGYTIALIGYICDYSSAIIAERIAPYTIEGDYESFSARVEEINALEEPDITVVVAHEEAETVAEALDPEQVDLVVGGHRHKGASGTASNGLAYIQGGYNGQGYATATLVITKAGEVFVEDCLYTQITQDAELLYDTPENAENLDETVLAISRAACEAVRDDMEEVLGYIDTPIDQTETGDNGATYAGNWFSGLMLRATQDQGTVAAFYNSGGIRTNFRLSKGENTRILTAGDIYTIAPFGNSLYVYELTGAELAQQLVNGMTSGNYGDQMSGLTFEYTVSDSGKNQSYSIVSITLDDGTAVNPTDTDTLYRVCTSSYSGTLAGGVFADKEPLIPAAEAPIDNITMIDLLREEAAQNDGLISVDTGVRGTRVG